MKTGTMTTVIRILLIAAPSAVALVALLHLVH